MVVLHLTAMGEPLRTRYGHGCMWSLLLLPAAAMAILLAVAELVEVQEANAFVGHISSSCLVLPVETSVHSSGVGLEDLRRGAETIHRATGWTDLTEINTIQAFLDNQKHLTWEEAIIEEKRRRDEAGLDMNPEVIGQRVTRRQGGDLGEEAPASRPPAPGPMEGMQSEALIERKTRGKATAQEKRKTLVYKLMYDIESATDLRGVFERSFLQARVEFVLGDLLGIGKREYHDLIIDILKRKRQAMPEKLVEQMVCVLSEKATAASVCGVNDNCADEEIGEEHVALVVGSATEEAEDEDVAIGLPADSNYQKEFWARVTDEVKVQLGGLAEQVTALVDIGSKINIILHVVYERGSRLISIMVGLSNLRME